MMKNADSFLNILSMWTVIILAAELNLTFALFISGKTSKENPVSLRETEEIHNLFEGDCQDKYYRPFNCAIDDASDSPVHTLVDSELGKLTVVYEMRKERNYTDLEFHLFACENIANEECTPDILNMSWEKCDLHSVSPFKWNSNAVDDESSFEKSCHKNISVTFDYVYSSCYFIKIEKPRNYTTPPIPGVSSCPIAIQTKYKKEFLSNKTIEYAGVCNPSPDGRYISLKIIEILRDVPKAFMTIEREIEDEVGDKKIQPLVSCENSSRNRLSEWDCKFYNNQTEDNCIVQRVEKNGKMTDRVERICNLYNLTDGKFTYTLIYNDSRCRTGTVWTRSKYVDLHDLRICQWYQKISCVNSTVAASFAPSVKKNRPFEVTLYVIGSLAVLISLCLIVVILYYSDICKHYKPIPLPPFPLPVFKKRTKVILIYARDCELFHDSMKKLTNVLTKNRFQVFDFWNDEQARDVTRHNFELWVGQKIQESDCVIVVTNDCGLELERRILLGREGEQYIEPQNFDRLFNYALLIIYSMIPVGGQQQKIFVVSLEDSMERREQCRFQFFSPVLYYLPSQLITLLVDLMRLDRKSEIEGLGNSSEFLAFEKSVKSYTDYVKENPDYSRTILEYEDEVSISVQ